MTITANITPEAPTDGLLYANNVVLTPTEAALGDGLKVASIIPVVEGQTIVAVVNLTVNGYVTGNSVLVALQTDMADGTWVDVAWAFWGGQEARQGTATFVLCGGGLGAMNNAFQQSRKASSLPATQASGSNAVPLGGRVRFTGFAKFVGGSSNVSGTATSVSATITYRIQHPR